MAGPLFLVGAEGVGVTSSPCIRGTGRVSGTVAAVLPTQGVKKEGKAKRAPQRPHVV